MSHVNSINVRKGEIRVNLTISKNEYDLIGNNTKNLLILPANMEFLNRQLTTGKLGNSNRIMLPKKILDKFEITNLEKKIPARAFEIDDDVFLLIRLKRSTIGIPVFKEV